MSKIASTLRGAGITPACPKCGTNEHVIRVWISGEKQWACSIHFKITSTKKKQTSFVQRLMHKLPEPDTFTIPEILSNRAYRRAQRGRKA